MRYRVIKLGEFSRYSIPIANLGTDSEPDQRDKLILMLSEKLQNLGHSIFVDEPFKIYENPDKTKAV